MKKNLKKALAVLLAAVLVFSFAACSKKGNDSGDDNKEKTKITVCLDWTPNTNHTGMYVALANGYYDEAGLDVSIVQPPENGATEACSAGQAQFAIDAQDTLAAGFTSDTPMPGNCRCGAYSAQYFGHYLIKGSGHGHPQGP